MLEIDLSDIFIRINSDLKLLLSNIKFVLPDNNIYVILGQNGSGKSTLIKSITNLIDRNQVQISGSVKFENIDLLQLSNNEMLNYRQKIKYVFQDPALSFDQLKKFKYYFNRTRCEKLKLEEMLDFFHLPNYPELKNMHPYELSVGMAQRVNLILSLAYSPEILILDEPTSALDSLSGNLVKNYLRKFSGERNNSVLIVTHDIAFALAIADKLAFMHKGNISDFYKPEEFLSVKDIAGLNDFISSAKIAGKL